MAKIGLMKKYIKLAGGSFKKAWRLQKAAQGKKKKPAKKKTVKKKATRKKTAVKKTVRKKVTKKKTVVKKRSTTKRKVASVAKKKKTTTKRRRRSTGGGRVQQTLMAGGAAALGAIGAGVGANMIPFPDPRLKAAIPIVAGVMLSTMKVGRAPMMKMVSAGMVAAGALALVKQFAPQVPLLAGEDDGLTFIPSNSERQAMLGYDQDDYEDDSLVLGDTISDYDDDDDLMGETYEMQGEYEAYPGQF